jgi:hypothetical protein
LQYLRGHASVDGPITLDFAGPESLTLVPYELVAYRGPLYRDGGDGSWLEFQLNFGGVVSIEQVEEASSASAQTESKPGQRRPLQ